MAKSKRLGRGLDALGLGKISNPNGIPASTVNNGKPSAAIKNKDTLKAVADTDKKLLSPEEIDISKISVNPHQPRNDFQEEALNALKESIKEYGVIQPIIVRKTVKGYELIAGERRYRASKLAGLKTIPAVVREYDDAQMTEVALIENIQRENLNPIEEAQAYQHLLSDYGLTQDMLSKKVGRSRPHITNFLRLLKLDDKVQRSLVGGTISMGQAKPLLSLEEKELQVKALKFIEENDLSVRKVEALVKHLQKDPYCLDDEPLDKTGQNTDPQELFIIEAEDKLKMIFGTSVRIKSKGKKQKLEIDFSDKADLDRIVELLISVKGNSTTEEKLARLREFSTKGKLTV